MTDPYTPTTEEVRAEYATWPWAGTFHGRDKGAVFDRWLAHHDAALREQVRGEFVAGLPMDGLRQAVSVLRKSENHWPADSIAQVIDHLERAAPNQGPGADGGGTSV